MSFSEFWASLAHGKKQEFADKVGKSVDYLRQIARGDMRAGALLAIDIEAASGGQVGRAEVRPDLFGSSGDRHTKAMF